METNQENVDINSPASAGLLPVKRKRGRPRKDSNSLVHGEKPSSVTPGSDGVKRRRKKISASPTVPDNALVGQTVNGVLDGSFDAGYLLTVRVGETGTVLRGVVFEPRIAVPISASNDVAPHAKMYLRSETTPPFISSIPPPPQFDFKNIQTPEMLHRNETSRVKTEKPGKVSKREKKLTRSANQAPTQVPVATPKMEKVLNVPPKVDPSLKPAKSQHNAKQASHVQSQAPKSEDLELQRNGIALPQKVLPNSAMPPSTTAVLKKEASGASPAPLEKTTENEKTELLASQRSATGLPLEKPGYQVQETQLRAPSAPPSVIGTQVPKELLVSSMASDSGTGTVNLFGEVATTRLPGSTEIAENKVQGDKEMTVTGKETQAVYQSTYDPLNPVSGTRADLAEDFGGQQQAEARPLVGSRETA
ncbi:nascent polypeptide-associated complex subunit alpha, muscle-specific form [Amborella trichopoda]|uniref:AT hook motif-containing protein n=1 Tax=Amborella trichopoda TaxID=13333 RepID=U5DBR8_AMBTC|nr:nascent polypeptide-associated complex subunit alpha, muscle-specific form [Amborella trichopoda]XP_011628454.1 nascent polypeptide-associated complex subunit alpha, muscle-specific form [Amborella trichopoda]XP_020531589.1 nascent polypeptide-associated complex subunit alpha, muscle-specific form [Amborella trichopoda]ERN19645.1 hypothetical protein AMTR_s00062p00156230 [Amborella trichopoda]|eukprot:XP_006858178.1 nascent polypeptide-associated complex subunit alpha, muscle-specific form [Amborella trichopoda]